MFLCKLYHEGDPATPVATHSLERSPTLVGRDPNADWVVADADREISRRHLELRFDDKQLSLTPLGSNGVFDETGRMLPPGEATSLSTSDAVRFGRFRMTFEHPPRQLLGDSLDETRIGLVDPAGLAVPTLWPDDRRDQAEAPGLSLLDAFCKGADLDISSFAGADAMVAMERAGAIYRQMVLGLADLLKVRTACKAEHSLDRTTIGAEDNNPFKWAPSRQLASDLLLREEPGFLGGAEASRASFQDIKAHMLATTAAYRSIISAALENLDPASVEAEVRARKSVLQSLTSACWTEMSRRHSELTPGTEGGNANPVNAMFGEAYHSCLTVLDQAASRLSPE